MSYFSVILSRILKIVSNYSKIISIILLIVSKKLRITLQNDRTGFILKLKGTNNEQNTNG